MRYTALIDGKAGSYGVTFPDLPGCTAMGHTIDSAIANAAEALRDWVEVYEEGGRSVLASPRLVEDLLQDEDTVAALAAGATLASVPLVRETGRPVRANLSIDAGILRAIDDEAARRKLTRSALIELLATRSLADLP